MHPFQAQQMALTKNRMVLEGREAILALAPQLEALAARCQQPGAMHWLAYFLDAEVLRHRTPRLALFLDPEDDDTRSLSAEQIRAAALFFEYEIFGFRTGIVATGDAVGFNSVIAPPRERASVAAAASRILLDRGAMVVLATFECAQEMRLEALPPTWQDLRWAMRQRQVPRILLLGATLDDTLGQMGRSTRTNLRRYRRRLEMQVEFSFEPEAAALLRDANLAAVNEGSLNPVPLEEFTRRVESASSLPGSFLCGLRTVDGRWLSLAGGWRQGPMTVLFWQMNAAGFERSSIGTVMRSYLMEHEIQRGAERLLLFGGTPHGMRRAFAEDEIADLVVVRRGLRAKLLVAACRMVSFSRAFPGGRFLAEILNDRQLVWRSARSKLLPTVQGPLTELAKQRTA